jgi:geranylgeranyl reductase family protein
MARREGLRLVWTGAILARAPPGVRAGAPSRRIVGGVPTPGPGVTVDLLVVGAGPAGCAAAVTGHRAGLDVLLVDKASFPRDKTCGDGLTTGALRLLRHLGVEVPGLGIAAPVDEAVIVGPSGRAVALPLPAGEDGPGRYAAVAARRDLDAALLGHTRADGVPVREGTGVTRIALHDDHVEAELGGGDPVEPVGARFVVAADGHYSAVRRLLERDRPPDLGSWHAARQYFRGVDDPRLWVIFERDLLPGYAWVFPLPGGRANVGFGVLRERGLGGKELKAMWNDLLERPALRSVLGPGAEPEDSYRAWPIPTAYSPDALVDAGGRVLYAGDAAQVVDPMTGEGIAQALETGMLAAGAVASAGGPDGAGSPEAVGARYREQVERDLGRDLRFAALLQRVLRRPTGARIAIRAAGLTDWTRRNFARWMFEDYPRALVLTPDRWSRAASWRR